MNTRIESITVFSMLLLTIVAFGCAQRSEKTAESRKKKIADKKEIAAQTEKEPETAHIILQFRGCKAHQ